MSFLDAFLPDDKTQLLTIGEEMALPKGEFLTRRGEPAGDMYVLQSGRLSRLNRRGEGEAPSPIGPGESVGSAGFVNDAPSDSDIQAQEDCMLVCYPRLELSKMLTDNPSLASTFYRQVAANTSSQLREAKENTRGAGAIRASKKQERTQQTDHAFTSRIKTIIENAKHGFLRAETRLRANGDDTRGASILRETLDGLQTDLQEAFGRLPNDDDANTGTQMLMRELQPWLVRSRLADLCVGRSKGVVPSPDILSHVLADTAAGEGAVGEQIDRWLLYRPHMSGIRHLVEHTVDLVEAVAPRRRNRNILLVHAGAGSVATMLRERLAKGNTTLNVLDHDRAGLGLIERLGSIDEQITVNAVSFSLGSLATGRALPDLPPQDLVVIHGLLEYLPDRLAITFLRGISSVMSERGTLVASAFAPSPEQVLFDRLLRWPTVRRSPKALYDLATMAKFTVVPSTGIPKPCILFRATHG